MTATRETYRGNGLDLTVHRFVSQATPDPTGIMVLLMHGFMDSGATWDRVAAPLVDAGHDVRAMDFRGFGTSDRVRSSGYYHFPDYLADVDALLRQLSPERLVLVGHSMGGTVASLYCGARPERVERLVLLEGIGPPAMPADASLFRTRAWLNQLAKPRGPRPVASIEQGAQRLGVAHHKIDRAILLRVAEQLTELRDDGTRHWRHDPMHATTAPRAFHVDDYLAFLRVIDCPVLFIGGGPDGLHPSDEQDRLDAISGDVVRVDLPTAGHMMHWTQPAAVAEAIADFLRS